MRQALAAGRSRVHGRRRLLLHTSPAIWSIDARRRASGSILEGLDEILTASGSASRHSLACDGCMNRSTVRTVQRNVKRWRNAEMDHGSQYLSDRFANLKF